MKVLVVNNIDVQGGAYRAAVNIHKSLLKAGIESSFYDYQLLAAKWLRKAYHSIDRIPLRYYPNRLRPEFFSPSWLGINIRKDPQFNETDIINLHWTNGGFISLKSLKWIMSVGKPIVWTLHDFWPISGGCNINRGCMNFTAECGYCPVLGSNRASDLSSRIMAMKKNIFQNHSIHWVTVSNWFLSKAQQSALAANAELHQIYNAIDTNLFKPYDKDLARKELNLPLDDFIILSGGFGITTDPNKGFKDLIDSFQLIEQNKPGTLSKLRLVIFGDKYSPQFKQLPLNIVYAGKISNDELLAKYYSAADVFVCSSQQETGPTTIIESMSCATPVISYNVGVVSDLLETGKNGYICMNNSPSELANGINYLLSINKEKRSVFGTNARNIIASNCSFEVTGNKYYELFQKIKPGL